MALNTFTRWQLPKMWFAAIHSKGYKWKRKKHLACIVAWGKSVATFPFLWRLWNVLLIMSEHSFATSGAAPQLSQLDHLSAIKPVKTIIFCHRADDQSCVDRRVQPQSDTEGTSKRKKKPFLSSLNTLFSVHSYVSVCGGCAGVAGKGALRRVWPRSRQGARKSRLANGLAPPQGHLQIHSTPPPPPSHHKLKDKIKQWFNVLPFMFIAVTTRTPRCCQELRRRVHRAAHKPAWKTQGDKSSAPSVSFFPFFVFNGRNSPRI